MGGGGGKVKSEMIDLDDDIISIDPPPAKISKPGHNNVSDALTNLNKTGIQISRGVTVSSSVSVASPDEGVDPLSLDDVSSILI